VIDEVQEAVHQALSQVTQRKSPLIDGVRDVEHCVLDEPMRAQEQSHPPWELKGKNVSGADVEGHCPHELQEPSVKSGVRALEWHCAARQIAESLVGGVGGGGGLVGCICCHPGYVLLGVCLDLGY